MSCNLVLTIKAATRDYLTAEAHRLAVDFFGSPDQYAITGAYSEGAPDSLGQYTWHVYVDSKD